MKRFLLVLVLFTAGYSLYAQLIMSNNNKALKFFEKGKKFQKQREFKNAIAKYDEAIQQDSAFAEAYRMAGAAYTTLNLAIRAIPYYMELAVRYPNAPRYMGSHLKLAEAEFAVGNYQLALKHSEKYLSLKTKKDQYTEKAKYIKENCQYALSRMDKPLVFNPRPLPYPLNIFKQQYFPVLTADLKTLFFIKRDKDEEIYTSSRTEDGGWTAPVPIDSALISEYNEGTCTISADGRTLVFTSCMRKDGFGSCDLYLTKKLGNAWATPKNMGPRINSKAWDSQPALSADGRTLYYVSNRKGGIGKRDIWLAHFSDVGGWSNPTNLGRAINTTEDDISPFIHVNGQTLYFATNGRAGFGGFDIYFSEKSIEKKMWSKPQNFGFPINTHNDELAMFITADGAHGYYSHEVIGSNIESKLYQIDIPDEISIEYRSSFISGIISDSLTKEPLQANIVLYNLNSNLPASEIKSDILTGEYLMVLTEGASYALFINAPNYLFKSYHFNLESDIGMGGISADIVLKPLKFGEKTTLNNVLFEHDSYALTKKSKSALIYVTDYLINHPDLNIEIAGFTDSVGTDKYNLILSENRAESVYNYLVTNGVDYERIAYHGYGSAYPIATNTNVFGRAKNRRIELIILE